MSSQKRLVPRSWMDDNELATDDVSLSSCLVPSGSSVAWVNSPTEVTHPSLFTAESSYYGDGSRSLARTYSEVSNWKPPPPNPELLFQDSFSAEEESMPESTDYKSKSGESTYPRHRNSSFNLPIDQSSHVPNRQSSTSTVSGNTSLYDLLTVFQAAPLAYRRQSDHIAVPLPTLNFEFERRVLTQTIEEACSLGGTRIDIDFQIATIDRLSFFLAREAGRILHFSCHGSPEYLALEDGRGGLLTLSPAQLKKWIALGGRNLFFVFVSACHSSFIGQAFVDAGVQHVVCCKHDSEIRESAAVEFEKTFYRNLACGTKTLQEAYNIAKEEILLSPKIPARCREEEAAKFCLLPANARHDVQVFFQGSHNYTSLREPVTHSPVAMFPPPPPIYLGRQLQQFQLIEAIFDNGLIRVSGCDGVGKSHIVKCCCQYLHERMSFVELDEIIWYTFARDKSSHNVWQGQQILPYRQIEEIFDLIRDDSMGTIKSFVSHAHGFLQDLANNILNKRLLIIIEAKELPHQIAVDKLTTFVRTLLNRNYGLKIIVIHRLGITVRPERLYCREQDVIVDRLGLESTVDLFGMHLPGHCIDRKRHGPFGVLSVDDLCDLLLDSSNNPSTKRMQDIYEMIGGGNPLQIHKAAKCMDSDTLDKLIALASHSGLVENVCYSSRAALTHRINMVRGQIEEYSALRNYKKCEELGVLLRELEDQESKLPDLHSLEKMRDNVTFQLDLAACSSDWQRAKVLQQELDELDNRIITEKNDESTERSLSDIWKTRVALEAKIRQLDCDYDMAFDQGNFDRAQEMADQSKQLKELRLLKPSKNDLMLETIQLKTDLGVAKQKRSIDAARMIHKRLNAIKNQFELEEEAEMTFGLNSVSGGNETTEDVAVNETVSSDATIPKRNRLLTQSGKSENGTQNTAHAENNTVSDVTPGAIAVGGCTSEETTRQINDAAARRRDAREQAKVREERMRAQRLAINENTPSTQQTLGNVAVSVDDNETKTFLGDVSEDQSVKAVAVDDPQRQAIEEIGGLQEARPIEARLVDEVEYEQLLRDPASAKDPKYINSERFSFVKKFKIKIPFKGWRFSCFSASSDVDEGGTSKAPAPTINAEVQRAVDLPTASTPSRNNPKKERKCSSEDASPCVESGSRPLSTSQKKKKPKKKKLSLNTTAGTERASDDASKSTSTGTKKKTKKKSSKKKTNKKKSSKKKSKRTLSKSSKVPGCADDDFLATLPPLVAAEERSLRLNM